MKRFQSVKIIYLLATLLIVLAAVLLVSCSHRHEFGPWVTVRRPTCTEKGLHERSCECGETRQEVVPSLSHRESGWVTVTAPTCENVGIRTKSCTSCGLLLETQTISRVDHKTVYHLSKEPTCEQGGWAAYHTCLNCDYTTYKELKPLGHDEIRYEGQKPSCTEEGWEAYETCTRCAYTTYESLPMIDHEYKDGRCKYCDHLQVSDGLEFESNDDGTCMVTGIGSYTGARLVIPERSPDGDVVTSIGYGAFHDCKTITSVVIPDTVTTIQGYAFYKCSNLESVTIPDSVTIIEGGAFNGCRSLTELELPQTLTTLKNGVFMDCATLKHLGIPDGIVELSPGLFNACLSLESVILPETMTSMKGYVFYLCASLKTIVLPDGMTNISSAAFQRCESLESIVIGKGVKTISAAAFAECFALETVFYRGTAAEREAIEIDAENNALLLEATWYYYSETQPTTQGNFWHYVDGVPTVW